MVNIIVDESDGKLLSNVSLPNTTISRRVQHFATDLNDQLIENIKKIEFRLQQDETTTAYYVWFIDGSNIAADLQRLKTCSRSLIYLYLKMIWIVLSALLSELMEPKLWLAAMEDYKNLFQGKPLMQCGPIALTSK